MEGLERLIGRSIGGKVTTSVEMERTTHSKSNALALAFSQMFHCKQMHNFVYCQKRRVTSKSYSSFEINWSGSELLKSFLMIMAFFTDAQSEEKIHFETKSVATSSKGYRYVCRQNKTLVHAKTKRWVDRI